MVGLGHPLSPACCVHGLDQVTSVGSDSQFFLFFFMKYQKFMTVTIRNAVPNDAAAIAAFQLAMALETEGKQLELGVVMPAVEEVFANPSRGFYLVGEIDGEVAGSLMVTYEWSDWRNSNLWYIQSVYVQEQFRGRGVFKNLYQTVIEQARVEKAGHVRLYVESDNERAQKVYESLGMKRLPYFMYDIKVD